jgi:hypothetical protein
VLPRQGLRFGCTRNRSEEACRLRAGLEELCYAGGASIECEDTSTIPCSIGTALDGRIARAGSDDRAVEPRCADHQYYDWCEHFWVAGVDCGAAR